MNSRASEPDSNRPATTDELLSHADWVRRLSRALLSDPNAAEDVAQDAWVAALKRPPTAGAGMRAWWARVVRSTASNHRRSEVRRADREQRVASERAEATDPQVESTLEAHRRLAAAIEALDEPLRAVIVAHFFHGASSREIAEREGVADSTIRTRLQKALEKLRRELDARAGGDRGTWIRALTPLVGAEHLTSVVGGAGWMKVAGGVGVLALAGLIVIQAFQQRRTDVWTAQGRPAVQESVDMSLAATDQQAAQRQRMGGSATAEATSPSPAKELVAQVEAHVVDARGAPVPGVRMKFTDRLPMRECTDADVPQSTSDALGRVLFSIRATDRSPHLAARKLLPAIAWDAHLEFSADGFETRNLTVTLTLGQSSAIGDVVLHAGGDIVGRCLVTDGSAPPEVRVSLVYPDLTLEDRDRAGRTGYARKTAGRNTACAPDGSYSMSGLPVGWYRILAGSKGHRCAISDPFQIVAGERCTVGDLVIEPDARVISGRVVTPDGSACQLSTVEVFDDVWGFWYSQVCDSTGRFTIEAPRADRLVLAGSDFNGQFGESLPCPARVGDRDLLLRLTAPRPFEVQVRTSSGERLDRYSVQILHGRDGRINEFGPGKEASRLLATSREFSVRVRVDGYLPMEQGPFTCDSIPSRLEFAVSETQAVHGRVVVGGEPARGMEVHLDKLLMQPRVLGNGMPVFVEEGPYVETQADGTFAIGTMDSGSFTLRGGRGSTEVRFVARCSIEPGRPAPYVLVDAVGNGSIRGHVESTLSTNDRAARVIYSNGFGTPRFERVAPDGSYIIENLCEGPWWLRVTRDDQDSPDLLPPGAGVDDPTIRRVELPPGGHLTCDFDVRGPDPRGLDGHVRFGDSAPSSWVASLSPEGIQWDLFCTRSEISMSGAFQLSSVSFGKQIVSLRSPGTVARDDVVEGPVSVPTGGLRWSLECDLGELDMEGQPGARVEVLADLPNGAIWTTHAILDANGRATLDSLPAAKARVSVAGSKDSPVEVEIPARGRAQVRLP